MVILHVFSLSLNQISGKQKPSEECHKEQTSTEEWKELLEKEEKKTSEQTEVLTNSSVEMSFKTNSDLLRTSVTPEQINQMPQLEQIFQLEPDGLQPTFQQVGKRAKEFAEEVATTVNAVVEQTLQVVKTEYQQPVVQMALRLQKKQQLRNEKLKKTIESTEEDSVVMKRKTENEGVVTLGTITVSGTDKSEILKPVNSETPVKMEQLRSIEKASEDSNGPVDVNLLGPNHQMIRPRILSWPKLD